MKTIDQVSEIVFEGIENNLSSEMTYKQEDSNFIFYAYKGNVIPQNDVSRVNAICRQYDINYDMVNTPRGIAFRIYLHS